MRRRIIALLTALASPMALAMTGPPAAAAPVSPRLTSTLAAFAWVDGTSLFSPQTTYNSAGGPVTVTENTSGFFQVTFGGLAFTGGDVQVSANNPIGGSCAVQSWGTSGSDLVVNVDCYQLAVPSDEQFYVLVTKPASPPAGVLDYAWNDRLTSSGTLKNAYSYNSSQKTNSVTHVGTGRYLVTMPGPVVSGANTGTVKVSAYGAGAGNCQIAGWRTVKTPVAGQQIGVDCFGPSGALQNRLFTIEYVRGNNLMGVSGQTDANALANGTAVLYQPSVQYDSVAGAKVTVIHIDKGYYEVVTAGSTITGQAGGGNGDPQLTTVGSAYVTCGIYDAGTHQPTFYVNCNNATGHAANTAFTFQWVVIR
ncbi:MAG TPA: hypothetical protein VF834_19895 [Streptosporangiaceae bacterium]